MLHEHPWAVLAAISIIVICYAIYDVARYPDDYGIRPWRMLFRRKP